MVHRCGAVSTAHGLESCIHTMQAEVRHAELKKLGLDGKIVLIGKKGITYFNRRTDRYDIVGEPLPIVYGPSYIISLVDSVHGCLALLAMSADKPGAAIKKIAIRFTIFGNYIKCHERMPDDGVAAWTAVLCCVSL